MSERGKAILLAAGMPVKERAEPDGDEPPSDDMPDDGMELSEGEKVASEDAMNAVKDDDAEAFGKAVKRLLKMGG